MRSVVTPGGTTSLSPDTGEKRKRSQEIARTIETVRDRSAPQSIANLRERPMTNQPTPDLMQQAAGRWLVALMLLQNEIGPITLEEQTAMLNKEMPPEDRISSVQYSRVNNGLRPVRPREALALARICQRHGVEIDPGWIIFGEHSDAPSPDSPLAEAAQLILPGTRRISPRGKRGESKPTRRQTRKPKE